MSILVAKNYLFGGKRSRWLPILFLAPGIFFYFLIALGPSLATIGYSFTDVTGIRGLPVNWVGLENYDKFLLEGAAASDNLDALRRTLIFCFFVTFIQFTFGLLLALLLNRRLRGRSLFRTLFFMPVILGVVIQGLMWKLFLLPRGGPMAELYSWLGIQSEFLGGQPTEAFAWVIVVQIWANVGITMVIFLAGMQTIPDDLYEAARMDGASGWQLFKNITWPQLTPAINTNFLLNVIGSLQAWTLFLVLVGYKNGTQVLGYVVFAEGFGQTGSGVGTFRQGYALIVMALGLSANWFVNRRERKYMP
jgi:raffinose/stachyose/melibiose transport system permease protein